MEVVPDGRTDTPARDIEEPTILVLVIDPSEFGRACTVAGLEAAPGLDVHSCETVACCPITVAPHLVLFQTVSAGVTLNHEITLAAQRWPATRLLVVADHVEDHEMIATIRAGAQGLLASSASLACLHSAILLLANDIGVYPTSLAAHLHKRAPPPGPAPDQQAAGYRSTGCLTMLTKRQQDVLYLLAAGASNKAIARRLRISESTVKVHLRNISSRNGATNRTQIVAYFLKDADRKS
jgi:DNA-binding NarL/FixJ family response regulator